MRQPAVIFLTLALILAGACGNDRTQTSANEPAAGTPGAAGVALSPEQLGELGAQIRKEPARADEILARRGLDQQSFEKQIRDVTENPEASKRYAEAYRKASA